MLIVCTPEDSFASNDDDAATLEEIWEMPSDERVNCRFPDKYNLDWKPTDEELSAFSLEENFDELDRGEQSRISNRIREGYQRCASSQFKESSDEDYSSNARAIERALSLCPDHPEFEYGEERHEAAVESQEQAQEQWEAGTRFGDGRRQVGEEVQPGSYYIEGNITDCYWETLDSAGNIIANNFVRSAQRVEAYISTNAYTFRSEGCGIEWQPL